MYHSSVNVYYLCMLLVETRAGPLVYQDRGEGRTLVLLHATVHDQHERRHRVIVLDWPGCGGAPAVVVPARLSAASFADDLKDLVNHIGP